MHRPSAALRTVVAGAVLALIVAACGGSAAASPSESAAAVSVPSAPPSPSDLTPSADASSDAQGNAASEAPADATSQAPSTAPSDATSQAPSEAPSDASAAPSASGVDPCSLITVSEANAVAGVKTLPPQPAGDPPSECVWATPTSGAVGQVQIDLGDGAKKAYDIDSTVLKHAFTPVAGLGDEAYAEDGAVFFRKGDTWIAIHIVRLDDSKLWMPKLIALAKTVVTRV